MKNLFENFNVFAEDSLMNRLTNLNESVDGMYLDMCMRKVESLIKRYDGRIATVSSSTNSAYLAGKLEKIVDEYDDVSSILYESQRQIKRVADGGSFIFILVDFDNIDYVVKQLKKDYLKLSDGFQSFITLDFEPYKEGLCSVGFDVKIKS